jgi:hypothetical protein
MYDHVPRQMGFLVKTLATFKAGKGLLYIVHFDMMLKRSIP